MSPRIAHLDHSFVRFIPDDLQDGVLYVSMEYKTVAHRCCCGCGEKVVTPISPAGWELTFDGRAISLSPSIGGGTCNSHYFIRRGRVQWARPLTKAEAGSALLHDQAVADRLYGGAPRRNRWWNRLWARVARPSDRPQ